MKNDPVLAMLGLCAAGRNLVSGEFSVEKAIKDRKATLVIIATDASDNTRKSYSDSCAYHKIPFFIYGTKDELGHALGKEQRAALAVTDPGLGKNIIAKLKGRTEQTEVVDESK
ncbi:MAG: ribosomal L7Ae/L30e/S12e/Gadd45 family protein [Lachnospiraceae bacterium]|nr:ribosomal L7Ae/L30e/S12e/Gadd45 family protein [Lachnospiraceae bacterium]